MLTLNQIDEIPSGLLDIESSRDLHKFLDQPTLLNLKGTIEQPLFLSVLLHANEDTGFLAIQQLLRRYENKVLPRSLIIFFGNVKAAKQGVRRLDGQPDYNRTWPGTEMADCPETRLMQEVVDTIAARKPFASIDVHNNTGKNPHYGCINVLTNEFLHLAQMFSRTVIYFETPKGTQSMAMSKICPAITLECGKPHLPHGVEHATDYIETVMHLEQLPDSPISNYDIDIYQTVARVTVGEDLSYSFTDKSSDILFDQGLDKMNFSKLGANTIFAYTQKASQVNLTAWNDSEEDVSGDYFMNENDQVKLIKPLMPAMLTLDEKIIRQDCLCYLMEELDLTAAR